MTKAFDSVSLIPLVKALKRIKIPLNINRFIIDLFDQRQMRVIINFGFFDIFTGEDGIDQGETISLLLWHIFYDTLLCRIQKDQSLGFTIKLKWPSKSKHTP